LDQPSKNVNKTISNKVTDMAVVNQKTLVLFLLFQLVGHCTGSLQCSENPHISLIW